MRLAVGTAIYETFAGDFEHPEVAWMTLTVDGLLKIEPDGANRSEGAVIQQAILVNLLSPKRSIFVFALLPQVVGRVEARPTLRMLEL